MALFEVPGWSVPSAAPMAPASSSSHSKKRKRPTGDKHQGADKISTAAANVEQLIAKLGSGADGEKETPKNKKQKTKAKANPKAQEPKTSVQKKERSTSKQQQTKSTKHSVQEPSDETSPSLSSSPKGKGKQSKPRDKRKDAGAPSKATVADTEASPDTHNSLTALQSKMKNSLEGARFRWINETLYKSDSQHAHEMMRNDPNVFSEYHTGFRHQVQSWPSNPVGHYVSVLSKYPARTVIADLGCGDAALARALVPKGLNVLSFDLVSDGKFVIEADICAKIPLPGSEEDSQDESSQIVDVVVCALSLMGTNWPTCIREAWRILKEGGELKVAEVASRFTNVDAFVSLVVSIGFKLRSKDDNNSHFTLFEFVKVRTKQKSEKEWSKVLEQGRLLKPCEYKRR